MSGMQCFYKKSLHILNFIFISIRCTNVFEFIIFIIQLFDSHVNQLLTS
jgi:hypothetical protein